MNETPILDADLAQSMTCRFLCMTVLVFGGAYVIVYDAAACISASGSSAIVVAKSRVKRRSAMWPREEFTMQTNGDDVEATLQPRTVVVVVDVVVRYYTVEQANIRRPFSNKPARSCNVLVAWSLTCRPPLGTQL